MKKIYFILFAVVAALSFTACSDGDQPSGNSIFVNDEAKPDAFEQWLLENFTYPYNVEVLYRMKDTEIDHKYTLTPADSAKCAKLAMIVKYLWYDAYAEVAGPDFVKANTPRVLQFIGSLAIEKRLWNVAERSLPPDPVRMADYTQAQMDLGATLCTRARPRCGECPLGELCVAHRDGRTGELPFARPKKKVPQRETAMVWLRDAHGRTLLQQRPARGIWASLWSLPEVDAGDIDAASAIASRHGRIIHPPQGLPAIEHAFTHYRLRIHPLLFDGVAAKDRVRDNDGLRWATRGELASLGIPAPVRRLIEKEDP